MDAGHQTNSKMVEASIWPVQQLDPSPREPSRTATVVPFPEAEFEDCTFHIGLDALVQVSASGGSSIDLKEEEPSTVSTTNGKKRAIQPSSQSVKRRKVQRTSVALAHTTSLFKVLVRSAAASGQVDSLFASSDSSPLGSFGLASRHRDRDENSIFLNALGLTTQDDTDVVTLPVVDAHMIPDDRSPARFTNGPWLLAAANLQDDGLIDVHCEATALRSIPGNAAEARVFYLELSLDIHLTGSAFGGVAQSDAVGDWFIELLRFCIPTMPQASPRQSTDGSLIYASMGAASVEPPDTIQPAELVPTMLPFQRRSVFFALGREGKRIDASGNVLPLDGVATVDGVSSVGLWWQQVEENLFFSPLFGRFTSSPEEAARSNIRGGMFADEMGLGKVCSSTLTFTSAFQLLTLLCMHPNSFSDGRSASSDPAQPSSRAFSPTLLLRRTERDRGSARQDHSDRRTRDIATTMDRRDLVTCAGPPHVFF